MSMLERAADAISPPILGEVCSVAITTTQAITDLEATAVTPLNGKATTKYFYDRYVTFQADGCDVYIAFSNTGAGTLAPGQTAAVPGTQAGIIIPNGQEKAFLMPTKGGNTRYLYAVAATGSGKLRFWASSPATGLGDA